MVTADHQKPSHNPRRPGPKPEPLRRRSKSQISRPKIPITSTSAPSARRKVMEKNEPRNLSAFRQPDRLRCSTDP